MAVQVVFDVEIINELTGETMNFEYDVEVPGYSRADALDYAERVENGYVDLTSEIRDWLSIVPRLSYIDGADDD